MTATAQALITTQAIITARAIIVERSGVWAARLRGVSSGMGAAAAPCRRIVETRAAAAAMRELSQARASLLFVEIDRDNLLEMAELLSTAQVDFPHSRSVVIAAREVAEYQWELRELGAGELWVMPRDIAPLARLMAAHLSRWPAAEKTFLEQLLDDLPWSEAAATLS